MRKKPSRLQSQMLFLSMALNVSLIATLVLVANKEKDAPFITELPSQEITTTETNKQHLNKFVCSSYHQLLSTLSDNELVEEGYAKRDLALGCLVTFYHFNLEKALGSADLQRRTLSIRHPQKDEKVTLTLFPGLTDAHYQAIFYYLQTEKWPFTPKGLFELISRSQPFPDPTLTVAYSHTPHFRTISSLFSKSGIEIEDQALVQMLAEGPWGLIHNFYTQQRLLPDLTPMRRRTFLLDYLEANSPLAARIFIEADAAFAAKRLSDEQIVLLFDLYSSSTPFLETFAKELLSSPRSDAVWKKASEKLDLPFPHKAEETASTNNSQNNQMSYTVQEGDSLWLIARKCKTTIDAIVELNKLDSEMIHPNMTLDIPLEDAL